VGCSDSWVQQVCSYRKRQFSDPDIFTALGYAWSDVQTVADSDVNSIPTAAPVIMYKYPPVGYIDAPTENQIVYGTINIGGWALDGDHRSETAISRVMVYVDGGYVGDASYGASREDVCNTYPNRPGCPNVGWNFSWNTSSAIDGSHTIRADYYDSDPDTHRLGSYTRNVTVNNLSPSGDIESIEQNSDGSASASGWAIDNATQAETPVQSVTMSIDGNIQGAASYGVSRPEVCSVYNDRPGCPNVGWTYGFGTSALSTGDHTLVAVVRDSQGQSSTISRTFHIDPHHPPTLPRATTDRDDDFPGKQIHLVYIVPSDGQDRQFDIGGEITTSVNAIQNWLHGQTGGKQLRIDTYHGKYDITYVHTNQSKGYYQNKGSGLLNEVQRYVQDTAHLNNQNKVYAMYFEGGSVYACGASYVPSRYPLLDFYGSYPTGEKCEIDPFGAEPNHPQYMDFVMMHEIFHSLGAVSEKAPHETPSNPDHVNDSAQDIMNYRYFPLNPLLDVNQDDYYGISLGTGITNIKQSPYMVDAGQ
jgi:hypothetical protein